MNAMRRWPSARRCASACDGGAPVIEHDVGDAFDVADAPRPRPPARAAARSHRACRRRSGRRPTRSSISRGYSSTRSARVPVAGDEVEVAGLQQRVLDPAHHQRGVALADLRHHHADGEACGGAAATWRACSAGSRTPRRRRGSRSCVACGMASRRRRAVQHERDRRRREAQLIREHAQRDACGRSRICGRASTTGSHACSCRTALGTRARERRLLAAAKGRLRAARGRVHSGRMIHPGHK